jgi:hypothetical protein
VETEPAVRASLALGLGELDPAVAEPVLATAAVQGSPEVRVAAAVALLRAGLAWPEGTVRALVKAIDDGATVEYCWARGADWSDELMVASEPSVAMDLLARMLLWGNPKTRQAGIWAMSQRCARQRSAPALFVPMVVPAVEDPDADVRSEAVGALRRSGAAAAPYADLLAGIAARFPDVASERGFTVEYRAVETLLRIGDPRWIEPVCAAAAAGHRPTHLLSGARFSLDVMAEVRDRLRTDPARADVLAGVVAQWGQAAAAAVPELLAALPHAGTEVTWALLEIGHDDPAVLPHLRARAAEMGDLRAAMAIWRMTGDLRPMLDTLHAFLSQHRRVPATYPDFTAELGEALLPLLPAAARHLSGTAAKTYPERETQILAARVAAVAGLQTVLPTVQAVLVAGHTPARAAANFVAGLAPAHARELTHLIPHLRGRLADRWSRLEAARALARLGVPTAELAQPLVRGITDYAGRYGIATILELHAAEAIPALENLIAGDERFGVSGTVDDLVWLDELLQEHVRAAIVSLRKGPLDGHPG